MLSDWTTWAALLDAALRGAAQPWLICLALVLTTFLLEDLALAAGAALAVQGSLSWELAVLAVGGGIALGDLGLYGLGQAANRVPYLRRRFIEERRTDWLRGKLKDRFGSAILLARVIPGLRLVTYTACGFFRLPIWPFIAWVLLAVTLWTVGLMWFGAALGGMLGAALGIPAPLAVGVLIFVLALALTLVRRPGDQTRLNQAGNTP